MRSKQELITPLHSISESCQEKQQNLAWRWRSQALFIMNLIPPFSPRLVAQPIADVFQCPLDQELTLLDS